jgi:hypothetical protein
VDSHQEADHPTCNLEIAQETGVNLPRHMYHDHHPMRPTTPARKFKGRSST